MRRIGIFLPLPLRDMSSLLVRGPEPRLAGSEIVTLDGYVNTRQGVAVRAAQVMTAALGFESWHVRIGVKDSNGDYRRCNFFLSL